MNNRILYSIAVLIIFSSGLFANTEKISMVDALETELESGQISRAEYVAYRLMSLTNRPDLPEKYKSYSPDQSRMGTSLKMEARALVDNVSGLEKRYFCQSPIPNL